MEDKDKTEEATPHKLEEAKKKGQVSKSVEFSGVLTILIMILIWLVSREWLYKEVGALFHKALWYVRNVQGLSDSGFVNFSLGMFATSLWVIFPFLIIAMFLGVLFTIIQTGFIFSAEPLRPKFDKLNPVKGIKKFFNVKIVFELIKSILKIVSATTLFILLMKPVAADFQYLRFLAPGQYASEFTMKALFLSSLFAGILFAFSIFDFSFVKWSYKRDMRMSKKEVKDEHKKREGDPQVKSKQKSIQKEILKKVMGLSKVKSADVVITNPTHYAVALSYRPNIDIAPSVVCSGKGYFAKAIKDVANTNGVRIIRKPALARSLFKLSQVGDTIPESEYNGVADIYRELWQGKGAVN